MSFGLPPTAVFIHDQANPRSASRYRRAISSASQMFGAEIVDVPVGGTGLIDSIHGAGMAYQDWLDARHLWWVDSVPLDPVAVIWDPYDLTAIDDALRMGPLRGDEIVFRTLDSRCDKSWVLGHPRAVLHWSITLRNVKGLEQTWPTHLNQPTSDHSCLVWWAQRINLRVYGVS